MGCDPKSGDNPTRPAPWSVPLALAQACPRCGARTRSGRLCRSDAERPVPYARGLIARRAAGRAARHVEARAAIG
jgi:hypothetical protein